MLDKGIEDRNRKEINQISTLRDIELNKDSNQKPVIIEASMAQPG